jgi:ankyrin repeat protein
MDVDSISTGVGNYGKTALFYALTRGREDMCTHLLLTHSASVSIVNNKGQTPLSLSITHVSSSIVRLIEKCEIRDRLRGVQWVNYSSSHSDGREYGDVDPRFVKWCCPVL